MTEQFPFENTTGHAIPAGGLVAITGVNTTSGRATVGYPATNSANGCAVLMPFGTPNLLAGMATFSPFVRLAYDVAEGIPVAGDTLGSVSGSHYAKKGNKGFRCLGGSSNGFTNAVRADADTLALGVTITGTDNHVVRMDGTDAIQDSAWEINDVGVLEQYGGGGSHAHVSTGGASFEESTGGPWVQIRTDLTGVTTGDGPGLAASENGGFFGKLYHFLGAWWMSGNYDGGWGGDLMLISNKDGSLVAQQCAYGVSRVYMSATTYHRGIDTTIGGIEVTGGVVTGGTFTAGSVTEVAGGTPTDGVTVTVVDGTTEPVITVTLQDITPDSVNATGDVVAGGNVEGVDGTFSGDVVGVSFTGLMDGGTW